MWSHGQTTLSTQETIQAPPPALSLSPNPLEYSNVSAAHHPSSEQSPWSIRPHDLSCQAHKSPSDASVTTPQLFINVTIGWLACTVSHGVYPECLDIKSIMWYNTSLTLNCAGVSRVLKSGEEAILSSSVCRKTLWKSNISGRLPKRDSIWGREVREVNGWGK